MKKIDAELIAEKRAITARPILAGCKLTERFDIRLPLTSSNRDPVRGVYDEVGISIRLHQWFEQRYGARLGVPFSIGQVAFPLRGVLYAVDCPMSYGTIEFVCEPQNWRSQHSALMHGGCNMIDMVQE